MESPPQYPGAPKKSKTGLIIGLTALALVLCCCGVCGVGGYMAKGVVAKGIGLTECGTAIGLQRDGILAYAAKNGGKLPSGPTWQDDIKPYVKPIEGQGKKNDFVHIPTPDEDVCDRSAGTSIVFNSDLAEKKLSDIKDDYGTVLLFEAAGKGRNRHEPWKEPSFATSPVLVQGERRGWIRQPLQGQAFFKNRRGMNQAAPNAATGARASFGPVDVESKESSKE